MTSQNGTAKRENEDSKVRWLCQAPQVSRQTDSIPGFTWTDDLDVRNDETTSVYKSSKVRRVLAVVWMASSFGLKTALTSEQPTHGMRHMLADPGLCRFLQVSEPPVIVQGGSSS